MLYTAKVSTTPRWLDFNKLNGVVRTPFPDALARKMFSRSSYIAVREMKCLSSRNTAIAEDNYCSQQKLP